MDDGSAAMANIKGPQGGRGEPKEKPQEDKKMQDIADK